MYRSSFFALATLLALSLAANAAAAGRTLVRTIDTSGSVTNFSAIHDTCTNDDIAGIDSNTTTKVDILGTVDMHVSASWDWGYYNDPNHPAALMNAVAIGIQDLFASCADWTATAEITFTRSSGNVIVAEIVGGSVYEIVIPPDPRVTPAGQGGTCPVTGSSPGTINEFIVSFLADPDDPNTPHGSIAGRRFTRTIKKIEGNLRTVFNSCTGETSSYIVTKSERP